MRTKEQEGEEGLCPVCDGKLELVREFVTREMAIDAGTPEREGELYGEYLRCVICGRVAGGA